jgi:[ribosomal protein S5]-alanine N-acetyltransferase
MNLLNVKIETERLLLIPISMGFKEVIFQEFTDEITTFMFPKSAEKIEETEKFISESVKGLKQNTNLQIVILNKKTKEFLGCGGLHHLDKIPEMGCWIKKSAHGNTFGREAITGLKQWADENLNYSYIIYPVDKKNHASKKIPESLGGKIIREYKKKNLSGRTLHLLEYRIYKKLK